MKRVAIVILNWNGKKLMEEFLPSVIDNTPEWAEIFVADNGSTDNSVEMLHDLFPSVNIIRFTENFGFAEGYNRALQQINHEYCVLLNSDVEVTPHWLEAPIKLLDKEKDIACVQPKIKAQQNKEYFEYAGAAGGFLDKYGYPFCRGRILNIVEKDEGQYNTPIDILWATGACLFIRTHIYKDAGGLDAGFFAHQEEIDLCWRLRSRGYRLVCVPQSVVYHVGGATLNAENPRKTFLNFRNSLLMLYKNSLEKDLKHVMRIRFWLDYIAATKFLLGGHFSNAKAIYQARKAYHQLKPTYETKRKINLSKRTVIDIPELQQNCLIFSFFLKGKKKYSQLCP